MAGTSPAMTEEDRMKQVKSDGCCYYLSLPELAYVYVESEQPRVALAETLGERGWIVEVWA
jgi:hypothetical protein